MTYFPIFFKKGSRKMRKKLLCLLLTTLMLLLGTQIAQARTYIYTYTIKSGDSLWKIARHFNTNVSKLKEYNHLTYNIIYPNQKIYIPIESNTRTNTGTKPSEIPFVPEQASTIQKEITNLVNAERAKQGLDPLKLSPELSNVAQIKAKDMADNNYFSHYSPTYGSPFNMMSQFGIQYRTAGENIAKGYKTASDVMNGWMNSSGHRANILNSNFDTIGVGYYNNVWVQMFIGN